MRLATLAVFAAVGASLAFWVLRWPADGPASALASPGGSPTGSGLDNGGAANIAADPAELRHLLLGQDAASAQSAAATASAPAAADADLRLVGVLARGHGGAALISVAGQPAKSYAVGRTVRDGLLLQSVGRRQAFLAASLHGPVSITLDLPAATEK